MWTINNIEINLELLLLIMADYDVTFYGDYLLWTE